MIVCAALINVRTRQPIPHKPTVAGALIRPHGVDTFGIQAADVARTFIDVHAALPITFKAAAARAAVAARQVFTALVAK